MPDASGDEPWLIVEANDDGGFYGSGFSLKPSGENVYYRSLCEDDLSLESAIAAATKWAEKYNVPKIWVQRGPWKLESA